MKVGDFAPLQPFRNLAEESGVVRATPGENGNVLGVGRSDHREVQWLGSTGDPAADSAMNLFMDALLQEYGQGIQASVARELGLTPGRPLEAREVSLAITMAEHHVGVFEGANFMTQLPVSASANGAPFVAICDHLGIDATALRQADRAAIDKTFGDALGAATQNHQRLVTPDEVVALMTQVLADHH
jgi:hypothetical protein